MEYTSTFLYCTIVVGLSASSFPTHNSPHQQLFRGHMRHGIAAHAAAVAALERRDCYDAYASSSDDAYGAYLDDIDGYCSDDFDFEAVVD